MFRLNGGKIKKIIGFDLGLIQLIAFGQDFELPIPILAHLLHIDIFFADLVDPFQKRILQ